jgi:L-iditol 2-dehydrogenase
VKAVRFHGVGDLRVDQVPAPTPGPDEVLIEPLAVGVCGTDTHIVDGHYPARPPVTLGHEVSGRVRELGARVTGLDVGDLVTIEPHRYCGACTYCRRGMEHMCLHKQAYGVHLDGGMAELMVAPARIAYRLPPSIDPAVAALTEPLSCCVHGMDRLEVASGLPILIIGCGPAGAILIALARQSGLHPIVAADKRADRCDLARRMGADLVLDPSADDFERQALSATGGEGYPYLIDAVGLPAVLEGCIRMSARGGRILVFGVAAPHNEATIRPNEVYTKELTILGTAINPFTHLRAAGLLERLPLREIRITSFSLDKAEEAMTAVRTGLSDKIQLTPSAGSDR